MFEHLCLYICICTTVILVFVCTLDIWIFSVVHVCACAWRVDPLGVQSQSSVSLYQYLTAEPETGWIFNMTLKHNKDMETWGAREKERGRDGGVDRKRVRGTVWREGEEEERRSEEGRGILKSSYFISFKNLQFWFANLRETTQSAQKVNGLNWKF